jgi:hypothetical protein
MGILGKKFCWKFSVTNISTFKKRKLFLSTSRMHIGEVEIWLHSFLIPALVWKFSGKHPLTTALTPSRKLGPLEQGGLGGTQNPSGSAGEEKNLFSLLG